jgi:hypothetical protein
MQAHVTGSGGFLGAGITNRLLNIPTTPLATGLERTIARYRVNKQ